MAKQQQRKKPEKVRLSAVLADELGGMDRAAALKATQTVATISEKHPALLEAMSADAEMRSVSLEHVRGRIVQGWIRENLEGDEGADEGEGDEGDEGDEGADEGASEGDEGAAAAEGEPDGAAAASKGPTRVSHHGGKRKGGRKR